MLLMASPNKHYKVFGIVQSVQPNRWYATLSYDGETYLAEMYPIDHSLVEGEQFVIHRTKRGQTYFYWPQYSPMTKHQYKKARIKARKWRKMFLEDTRYYAR
jgi:hypothetical protein